MKALFHENAVIQERQGRLDLKLESALTVIAALGTLKLIPVTLSPSRIFIMLSKSSSISVVLIRMVSPIIVITFFFQQERMSSSRSLRSRLKRVHICNKSRVSFALGEAKLRTEETVVLGDKVSNAQISSVFSSQNMKQKKSTGSSIQMLQCMESVLSTETLQTKLKVQLSWPSHSDQKPQTVLDDCVEIKEARTVESFFILREKTVKQTISLLESNTSCGHFGHQPDPPVEIERIIEICKV
mmetsp:Transcript_44520/g.93136  ORF Transcript_44520/g.93136 Transcript_44520/m.93136 type:complete len:242 (-) Transcript_44520:342-1067(-)